jgi:FixJ family two-component response regulator
MSLNRIRSEKQIENDKKLSVKLREYHQRVKTLKEKEKEIMHQVIDDLESNNIIVNVDEPEIVETEIEKKKRGRPKGSTSKKKNLNIEKDIQSSGIIISPSNEDLIF